MLPSDNVTRSAFAGAISSQPHDGASKPVCASAVSQRYHKAVHTCFCNHRVPTMQRVNANANTNVRSYHTPATLGADTCVL